MISGRKITAKQAYRYSKKWIQNILLELSELKVELEELKEKVKLLENNNKKT